MNKSGRVAFVTGASSGIGLFIARHLSALGCKVYGASRSQPLESNNGITFLSIDVDDCNSVLEGVERIVSECGRIDIVVNCAGFGIAGAIEDTSIDEAHSQFETNFFGVHRVCRQVLPVMRKQGAGLIINVSSLAGLTAIPFQGFYSASKFAIEGFTEALRMEVAQFGVKVVLLEPGDYRTNFTSSRKRTRGSVSGSAYEAGCEKAVQIMERDEQHGPSPEAIARTLDKILNSRSPRLRYTTGRISQRLGVALKRVLPYGIYEKLLMATYGMK